ncbi:MAG: DEAD/DEAH box helicase, partial [Chloroflexi bacterium]|nr:DEAD/DEAH box helicase [Chloroflexota bacterium]
RGLILAHRKELVEQPLERLGQYWPEWVERAGIVMAERDECDRDLVVATVQTLMSRRRLRRLIAHGPIQWLITDECHHSIAEGYGRVYEALHAANPEMRHLGVTATPIRADGSGLVAVYDAEAFHYGIREMVRMGYLVPPRWLAIATGISLQGVKKLAGDYSAKSLANVYETQNCFELVVASHLKYAPGRQAIAFTPTVEGAYRLAERFTAAGVPAAAADGTTAKRDRADILAGFRAGRTQVLVNVGLYTEGLDVPEVSCIHMVRPTKSDGLYVQCVGRGLRTAPGKEDALILDYAPIEVRNVCMLGDVLGVAATKDAYLEPEKREQEGEVLGGFTFDGDIKWLRGDPMELVSRQLDYIDLSPVSWRRDRGWLTVGLGRASDGIDRSLVISKPDGEGVATLWQVAKEEGAWDADVTVLAQGTWDALTARAEEVTDRYMNAALAAKDRQWRKQPASEAQIRFARKLGVWQDARPMNKGETAQAITHALALRAVLGKNWQQRVGLQEEAMEVRASVCA